MEFLAGVISLLAIFTSLILFSIWMNIEKELIYELGIEMVLNIIKAVLILGTAFYMNFVFNINTIIAFVSICLIDYIFGKIGYKILVHLYK